MTQEHCCWQSYPAALCLNPHESWNKVPTSWASQDFDHQQYWLDIQWNRLGVAFPFESRLHSGFSAVSDSLWIWENLNPAAFCNDWNHPGFNSLSCFARFDLNMAFRKISLSQLSYCLVDPQFLLPTCFISPHFFHIDIGRWDFQPRLWYHVIKITLWGLHFWGILGVYMNVEIHLRWNAFTGEWHTFMGTYMESLNTDETVRECKQNIKTILTIMFIPFRFSPRWIG